MPKGTEESRKKYTRKTLTEVLEALVEEEFAQNRRAIVDQIAADAASRLLAQKPH